MAKRVIWTAGARSDLRAIDRETAIELLQGLARFLLSEEGDVKRLQGVNPPEFRLRLGDYRIRFRYQNGAIEIVHVKHRKDAYR